MLNQNFTVMLVNDFNLIKSFFNGLTSKEVDFKIDNAHSFTVTLLDEFATLSSIVLERIYFRYDELKKHGIIFYVTTHPVNHKLQVVFYDD